MKKNLFLLLLFIITLAGVLLRFWNYNERFGLAYDQAHDALVARSALSQHKLPLLGPFSSAGPFQTSGTWYWLLMVPTAIYRNSVLSPWIFLTALYGFLIIGMGIVGRKIENDYFGLLLAGLTALSTAQIAQSVNLTNQTPIPLFSFLTIACAIWYVRKKTVSAAFGMGLCSGFAASIHLQGMALGILVFMAFILGGRIKIHVFLSALLGALLPMLPIVLWDMSNDFVNIKNMIYYYRFDQFNISLDVLGRRWLTYLTDFWPREWAHIIGGNALIAMLISGLAYMMFLYLLMKRRIQVTWALVFVTFVCMVILIRYTHVPLFSSFIVFTHPFVLLISAWVIYRVFTIQKIMGWIVLCIVLVGSTNATFQELKAAENRTSHMAVEVRKALTTIFPHETFSLYDWNYSTVDDSLPIVLYLDEQGLSSDTGRKIGVMRPEEQLKFNIPPIATFSSTFVDLSATDSSHLIDAGWHDVNPNALYHETEEWR